MIWCVYAPYLVHTKGAPGRSVRSADAAPAMQTDASGISRTGKEFDDMDLNYFKDCLFDLLNEWDSLEIVDIEVQDRNDTITVTVGDGSVFEIRCRPVYRSEISMTVAAGYPCS